MEFKMAGQLYIDALRDVIPITEPIDKEQEEIINKLKENCYSNLAACQLKLKQYDRVVRNCTKSLDVNDKNIKCLYRRALGYLECRNRDSADQDIKRIRELEPNNSVIKELETKLSALNKEADKRDAAMMRSFLSK